VNWIGLAQGLYYLLTALWPFFSLQSFITVTGPKTDVWLVRTVAALLIVIGVALIVGSSTTPRASEAVCLGILSALALAIIDTYYALRRVIRKIYLCDAVVEVLFMLCWGLYLARE
jgi:drug/metabolite transporter (DMT)-like permease